MEVEVPVTTTELYLQVTVTPSEAHPWGRPLSAPVVAILPAGFVGAALATLLPGCADELAGRPTGEGADRPGAAWGGVALGRVTTMASTANPIHIKAVAVIEKPAANRSRRERHHRRFAVTKRALAHD